MKSTTSVGAAPATPLQPPVDPAVTALGARLLLCLAVTPMADSFRCQLEDAGWSLNVVIDMISAARALRSNRYETVLLFVEKWTADQCEALRILLHSHYECEWVGVFSDSAKRVRGCPDLVLGYLFDHHTLPVDLIHLSHSLGHAHGHYALRKQVMPERMAVPGTSVRSEASARPVRGSPTSRAPHLTGPADEPGGDGAPPVGQTIIGQSAAVKALLRQIRKVAATDAPVLIGGESGSGKELAAQAIHRHSRRRAAPFIAVNCGALAATLIQAELFGAARGAYTGAVRERKGLLEAADGGTIFLDEIADLPLDMQINLLRFLQEQTITPVGASHSMRVDVRVVAAANIDLQEAVRLGRFRHDLFYRLNVLPITAPPLRERRDDIILLARHFFERYAADRTPGLVGFSAAAIRAMLSYEWPGNVRELINRVRRALVMSEGRLIHPHDLGLAETTNSIESVDRARQDAERVAVCTALERTHRNITRAARELGVSRMTLYRMMDRHQIERVDLPAAVGSSPLVSLTKISAR